MPLAAPMPFREALESREVRNLLPTSLGSAELQAIQARLLERSLFSARVTNAQFLQEVEGVVSSLLNPTQAFRADGSAFTAGLDPASARLRLKEFLQAFGYEPENPADIGTIKDLRTDQRLNLIVETNTKMAQGYGRHAQGQDEFELDRYPAQELFRLESRNEPRDWISRWRGAGGGLYDGGRMIARKNDPIWEQISAFGLPYPPFDFNSGMWVRDVEREDAEELGVIEFDERIEPESRDFNQDMQMSAPIRSAALREALLADLGEGYAFEGDTLVRTA